MENPPKIVSKHRHTRASKPIPIGLHHTVCGSEAINLAKRLTEELASQQVTQGGSLGNTTAAPASAQNSPEELRSRSLEQGEKQKGNVLCEFSAHLSNYCNRFGTFSSKAITQIFPTETQRNHVKLTYTNDQFLAETEKKKTTKNRNKFISKN